MPWSVESLSPQCSDLAELPAGHSQGASGQCAHVVLSLAYRGQHRSSGHLNPHAFLTPSHFPSETHCFYSPSNLGVSLASLVVILIYVISGFSHNL